MKLPVGFSQRVHASGEAPISYLMEQGVTNPSLISLAAGLVDQESLPVDTVCEAIRDLLSNPVVGRESLQYGTTVGSLPFRSLLAEFIAKADGCAPVDSARVIVGTGSQQLLYLLSEILLDPGDIVLLGVPAYFVFLGVLESFSARIIPVRTDEHGLIPEDLDRRLGEIAHHGELNRVKFIYDVSYFNNPTGLSLSAERRPQVVEIARRWSLTHRIHVVEDAAYRELRYRGDDIPSMMSSDPEGETVIYAGTFSKPFAPGVRTGYMVAPSHLVKPLIQQKGHHDFGSANLTQQLARVTLESGGLSRHLDKLRAVYRSKLDAMLAVLADEVGSLAGQMTWTRPNGGLYVWVRLPAGVSTEIGGEFFSDCLAEGVLYVPGNFCYPKGTSEVPANYARLSFGHQAIDRCREGTRRFCQVARRHVDDERRRTRRS